MDYKKCNRVSTNLLSIAGALIIGGCMLRSAVGFANTLLIVGGVFFVASFAIKFKYWRCPHCGYPIPMSRIHRGNGKTYECPGCKAELEIL